MQAKAFVIACGVGAIIQRLLTDMHHERQSMAKQRDTPHDRTTRNMSGRVAFLGGRREALSRSSDRCTLRMTRPCFSIYKVFQKRFSQLSCKIERSSDTIARISTTERSYIDKVEPGPLQLSSPLRVFLSRTCVLRRRRYCRCRCTDV